MAEWTGLTTRSSRSAQGGHRSDFLVPTRAKLLAHFHSVFKNKPDHKGRAYFWRNGRDSLPGPPGPPRADIAQTFSSRREPNYWLTSIPYSKINPTTRVGLIFGGMDGTRTRDLLRDRQAF